MKYVAVVLLAFLYFATDASAQRFDRGICEQNVFLAFASYCDTGSIDRWACSWCRKASPFKLIQSFNVNAVCN